MTQVSLIFGVFILLADSVIGYLEGHCFGTGRICQSYGLKTTACKLAYVVGSNVVLLFPTTVGSLSGQQ